MQGQHFFFSRFTDPTFVICHEFTSSKADDSSQSLPSSHDDGSQNLASQEAVLDAGGQGVETLVAQHGYLVVQSAAANR